MTTAPQICLITPGHAASTPRLVKNAAALAAAGYRVHIVAGRHFPPADALDAELFASAAWSRTLIDYRGGPAAALRKVFRRLARRRMLQGRPPSVALAAVAQHAEFHPLVRAAAAVRAQLYFGHCLTGLPVAAAAARIRAVPYGWDAEDFHDEETAAASADPVERSARQTLQRELLPACKLFTTAAPLIGREYARVYGAMPVTILNVFPLSDAPLAPVVPRPISEERPAVAYWFSQTIGEGRGLEQIVAVLGRMRTPIELQVRGFAAPGYQERLGAAAAAAGLRRPVRFLPPGPPGEMARLASGADLGLSLEERLPLNRDLCLTNKIFVYLLAGIPQLLSTTRAQTDFAAELGRAALLTDIAQTAPAAAALDAFFADTARVAAARDLAWKLAQTRFNWDREKHILLSAVQALLPLS
jgi:hypothetical protein